jgi:hypothetical protein
LKKGRPLPFRCPPAANFAGQDIRSYGTPFSAGISLLVSGLQAANISASRTNATNVAVDPKSPGRLQAFIFDAAGVHADLDTRDLAVLEVTSLLFASGGEVHQQFLAYQPFYTEGISPGDIPDDPTLPHLVRNTRRLLVRLPRAGYNQ